MSFVNQLPFAGGVVKLQNKTKSNNVETLIGVIKHPFSFPR